MQRQEEAKTKGQVRELSAPEVFQIYAKYKMDHPSRLQIQEDIIKIEFLNRTINWKDVLAIVDKHENKSSAKLTLTLFSKQKKLFKGIVRCEEEIVFYSLPEYVEKLVLKVRRFMTHSEIESPKFLIFFNPISGANSRAKLQRGIQFIKKTHFQYEVITTKARDYCQKYLRENKPSRKEYWGVALFSGDGLMHQFANSGCDIPVIHIPAGSGNGFAKSQAVFANEECGVEENLFIAMKGLTTRIPLIELQLEKIPQKMYCMMNVEWAFLSDIDMESQFLRWMGTLRYEVYSVWRIIKLRSYYGKISFSETDADIPDINQPITKPSFQSYQTSIYNFHVLIIPYVGEKYFAGPLMKMKSDHMDLQIVPESVGRSAFLKYMLNFEKGTHFDLEERKPILNFQHNSIKSFRLQPLGERRGILGIDGQQYQAQRIQGKIVPDAMDIFTLY